MKHSRLISLIVLAAALLMLSAGGAWAAPTVHLHHATQSYIVDGKTVYEPKDLEELNWTGREETIFNGLLLFPFNLPSGLTSPVTMMLSPDKAILLQGVNGSGERIWERVAGPGQFEVDVWERPASPGDYYVGDENGLEINFQVLHEYYDDPISYDLSYKNLQTAFAGTSFDISFDIGSGNTVVSGEFGNVRTTEYQLQTCAPFIELSTDISGQTLTGIKWRFVNPSVSTDVAVSNDEKLEFIDHFEIFLSDPSGGIVFSEIIGPGIDPMEGTRALSVPVSIDKVLEIGVIFNYEDSDGENSSGNYDWFFYMAKTKTPDPVPTPPRPTPPSPTPTPPAPSPDPEPAPDPSPDPTPAPVPAPDPGPDPSPDPEPRPETSIQPVPSEEIDVIRETLSVDVTEADDVSIRTGTGVIFTDGALTSAQTSSAIAVRQDCEPGGAVMMGKDLKLPLLSVSLSGVDLPVVSGDNDFREKYSVLKSFENGGTVDLMSPKFGGSLVTYDEAGGTANLNATIVVIDGPAPAPEAEDGIERPYSADGRGNNYGVKLSGNVLYIYDGVLNGTASDPIVLAAKTADDKPDGGDTVGTTTSGSSGCSSFPFVLLAVIALPILLRGKRD